VCFHGPSLFAMRIIRNRNWLDLDQIDAAREKKAA
jgi:hypothetical protein